jgi:hypothetical protein
VERLAQNQIYSKIEGNSLITNKAALLDTMTGYYKDKKKKNIFGKYLPVTLNLEIQRNLNEN